MPSSILALSFKSLVFQQQNSYKKMNIRKQIEEKLKHISVCRKEQTNDEQSFKELTKLYSEALTLSYQSTEVKDIRNVFYRFAGFIEKSAYKYNFFQHLFFFFR